MVDDIAGLRSDLDAILIDTDDFVGLGFEIVAKIISVLAPSPTHK